MDIIRTVVGLVCLSVLNVELSVKCGLDIIVVSRSKTKLQLPLVAEAEHLLDVKQ